MPPAELGGILAYFYKADDHRSKQEDRGAADQEEWPQAWNQAKGSRVGSNILFYTFVSKLSETPSKARACRAARPNSRSKRWVAA